MFDRVNHEKMIKCLNDIGINWKDLKLEKSLSDDIRIKRGVRQGCVLSPCFFYLYAETIYIHIKDSKGVTIGGTRINSLQHADATVLLADSEENLQNIMNEVNEVGKLYNMKRNSKKTKVMVISRNENNQHSTSKLTEQRWNKYKASTIRVKQ